MHHHDVEEIKFFLKIFISDKQLNICRIRLLNIGSVDNIFYNSLFLYTEPDDIVHSTVSGHL